MFITAAEEVLCDGKVKFFNQPLGIIVAETEVLANKVAKLVKVTYKNTSKPILTIPEAKKIPERVTMYSSQTAKSRGFNISRIIKASANIFSQYHYSMEMQVCVTLPSEDGLDVYPSTQWMDKVQFAIAQALTIDKNR